MLEWVETHRGEVGTCGGKSQRRYEKPCKSKRGRQRHMTHTHTQTDREAKRRIT